MFVDRFGPGLALGDAARKGRNLRTVHAIVVLLDQNAVSHGTVAPEAIVVRGRLSGCDGADVAGGRLAGVVEIA